MTLIPIPQRRLVHFHPRQQVQQRVLVLFPAGPTRELHEFLP